LASGVVADVDISSQALRFMGNARYTLYAVIRILQNRSYRAKLAFKGQRVFSQAEADNVVRGVQGRVSGLG